jgi:hypothetical protein
MIIDYVMYKTLKSRLPHEILEKIIDYSYDNRRNRGHKGVFDELNYYLTTRYNKERDCLNIRATFIGIYRDNLFEKACMFEKSCYEKE